jgi:hypothetical protein
MLDTMPVCATGIGCVIVAHDLTPRWSLVSCPVDRDPLGLGADETALRWCASLSCMPSLQLNEFPPLHAMVSGHVCQCPEMDVAAAVGTDSQSFNTPGGPCLVWQVPSLKLTARDSPRNFMHVQPCPLVLDRPAFESTTRKPFDLVGLGPASASL